MPAHTCHSAASMRAAVPPVQMHPMHSLHLQATGTAVPVCTLHTRCNLNSRQALRRQACTNQPASTYAAQPKRELPAERPTKAGSTCRSTRAHGNTLCSARLAAVLLQPLGIMLEPPMFHGETTHARYFSAWTKVPAATISLGSFPYAIPTLLLCHAVLPWQKGPACGGP